MLILARFATGVSAGFLTPASLSIITTNFAEGDARNRALLVYGGAAAGGFSLGMVAGGLLTSIDWRWVFFAPVLFATGLLVVARRALPRDGDAVRRRGGFDVAGAVSLTTAMLLLVLGVVRLPDVAWVQTATTLAGGVVLLAVFSVIERRSASPLVRLGILRSAPLVRANLGALLFVGSFVGFQFIAVLYLQELRGWSALTTGLALMVAGIDTVIAPTLTPLLVRRFGNVRVVLAGMAVGVVAYAAFLQLEADWTYAMMLPALILIGVAFALVYGPLTIAATDGIDEAEQGLAGGLLNAAVQFGAALILAIVTAVNVVVTDGATTEAALLDGYRAALVVPLVAVVLAIVITATGLRRQRVGQELNVGSRPHMPLPSTSAVSEAPSTRTATHWIVRSPSSHEPAVGRRATTSRMESMNGVPIAASKRSTQASRANCSSVAPGYAASLSARWASSSKTW